MQPKADSVLSVVSPVELIKNEITSGFLKPGERIAVQDVSERYAGLSSIVVRDALFRLQQMELVESTPHVGFHVVNQTPKQYLEMMFLSCKFETFSVNVVPTFSLRDGLLLKDMISQMGIALVRKGTESFFRCHRYFLTQLYYRHSLDVLRTLTVECWNKALLAGFSSLDRKQSDRLFLLDHALFESLCAERAEQRKQIVAEIEKMIFSAYADYLLEKYPDAIYEREFNKWKHDLDKLL